MKKRYRVSVKAIDSSSNATDLGSVVVEAKDRDAAMRIGKAKLWTPELEQSGASAETHAERIAGEGG